MDKKDAINLARTYTAIVSKNYSLQKAYLFGSYIKGTNHEESDIDIAFVFNEVENSFDLQLELMRLRRKIDSRIEPHPFGEIDFDYTNPLAAEIMKHGYEISVKANI
jgi:predicted nucleotidyltransferase